MTEDKEVSWAEAIVGGNFIKFEEDDQKNIVIKNWKLVETEKEFNNKKETKIEFQSDCVEENGKKVEKVFNTTSNRLKKKLREVLEKKDASTEVKLSILMIGKAFDVRYSVKEVTN